MATISLPVPAPSASLTAVASPSSSVRRLPPLPPDRAVWWGLSGVAVFISMALLHPGRRRSLRAAFCLASLGTLFFAIGCGGGGGGASTSSSGGGGGGGGTGGGGVPAVTTTTLSTTSTKLGAGAIATLTATVTSSNALTGEVCFLDATGGALTSCPTLVNGSAQIQITNAGAGVSLPGTHIFNAIYSGDANNQQSHSSELNIVETGTTTQGVCGQNGSNSHCSQVTVTIQ
jgi:Bacterial Ig-like domain (group 3)